MKDQIIQAREKRYLGWQMSEEAQDFLENQEESLERAFQEKWDLMFPGISVRFLSSRSEVYYLYTINGVVSLPGGRWATENKGGWDYYEHNTQFVDCPVPIEKLKEFMSLIEQETSLHVELAEQKFKTADMLGETERICTPDDLQCKYGPFTLLEDGEIWEVGWDVPDHFVVGQYPDGHIAVWFSTNGHGFGYDVWVERGQVDELDRFYRYLESRETDPLKTTKERIVQSWK
jgi:hypothetical protein